MTRLDLGGTSLSAVRLVSLLRRRTGLPVEVAWIFAGPTPRDLGARLAAAQVDAHHDLVGDERAAVVVALDVLGPGTTFPTTALLAQHPTDANTRRPEQDLVATATAAGSFQTLLAAVKAAGLVETLQGPGPFTVFAPTDEAFAKLGKDAIADLTGKAADVTTGTRYDLSGVSTADAEAFARRALQRLIDIYSPLLKEQYGTTIEPIEMQTSRWPFSVHVPSPGHFQPARSIFPRLPTDVDRRRCRLSRSG